MMFSYFYPHLLWFAFFCIKNLNFSNNDIITEAELTTGTTVFLKAFESLYFLVFFTVYISCFINNDMLKLIIYQFILVITFYNISFFINFDIY